VLVNNNRLYIYSGELIIYLLAELLGNQSGSFSILVQRVLDESIAGFTVLGAQGQLLNNQLAKILVLVAINDFS
jgi:hypothetical protein